MTAPEPTPTAEHIDAVARAMRQDPKSGGRNMSDVAREVYAERLLTLTDPAVHAAMLAALVRAGAWERAMDGHEPAAGMCLDVECFCGWPTREDFERGGDNWTPDYREHLLDILAHEVAP